MMLRLTAYYRPNRERVQSAKYKVHYSDNVVHVLARRKKPKFKSYLNSAALITSITFFSNQAFAGTRPYYTVKNGDILSRISRRIFGPPIYGEKGSLHKILTINQAIKNPNVIYPGQRIKISDAEVTPVPVAGVPPRQRGVAAITDPESNVPESSQITSENENPAKDVVELTPGMAIASIPTKKSKRNLSSFDLSFTSDYSAIRGTALSNGTHGNFLSGLNVGLRLEWMQHWSQGVQTSFFTSGKKLTFLEESHGTPIYNRNLSLFSFGGSVKIVTSSRLNFIAGFEIAQTLFYEGHPSDNGFEINTPPILRIHPGLDYRFLKVEGLELRGETGVSLYSPGSYDQYNVNLGYGYDLGLKVSHTLESQNIIHCKLFYGARKQDTSLLNFTELLTGMQCGLSFGGVR